MSHKYALCDLPFLGYQLNISLLNSSFPTQPNLQVQPRVENS